MMAETKDIIDALQSGDNLGAEQAFKDSIASKVGDALETKRKEVLSNLKDLDGIGDTQIKSIENFYQKEEYFVSSSKTRYGSCLLYTSPSPRDGLLSRMPSSA